MIEDLAAQRSGTSSWLLTWSSTLDGATYYVWRDGVLIATTTHELLIVAAAVAGESPVFEVFDSSTDVPAMGFPGWVQLAWYAAAGATHYRVEQYVSGSWVAQRTIDSRPALQPYFTWKSATQADATTAQFRVVPVSAAGNDGTPTPFTTLIVRVPDVPAVAYTYNGAVSKTVTIAAS